jgi:hypothetical protein
MDTSPHDRLVDLVKKSLRDSFRCLGGQGRATAAF